MNSCCFYGVNVCTFVFLVCLFVLFYQRWSTLTTPIFKHQSPGAQQMDSLETNPMTRTVSEDSSEH